MPTYEVTITETHQVVADSTSEAVAVAEEYAEARLPTFAYTVEAEILSPDDSLTT